MEPAGIVILLSVVAIVLSDDAIVTVMFEGKVAVTGDKPEVSCNSTAICLYTLLSARTCGGPSKIVSLFGEDNAVVLNTVCVEAYPCPKAVMSVSPGVVVEVKFAIA